MAFGNKSGKSILFSACLRILIVIASMSNLKRIKMKKTVMMALATAGIIVCVSCKKQDTVKHDRITFEELNPGADGYYIGKDGKGGFTSGNAFFPTYYQGQNGWSGFAYSNQTDDTTRTIENQFSPIAGSGAGHSSVFAVYYSWQKDTISFQVPEKVTNFSVCNSTYAYYSMLYGDPFSKKFGGPSGDDPDYFKLIIEGLDASYNKVLQGEITLADFTFQDNSKDYISNAWTDIDLSQAGFLKYMVLYFASSDTGSFGINTPTYVCIDNIFGELQE